MSKTRSQLTDYFWSVKYGRAHCKPFVLAAVTVLSKSVVLLLVLCKISIPEYLLFFLSGTNSYPWGEYAFPLSEYVGCLTHVTFCGSGRIMSTARPVLP